MLAVVIATGCAPEAEPPPIPGATSSPAQRSTVAPAEPGATLPAPTATHGPAPTATASAEPTTAPTQVPAPTAELDELFQAGASPVFRSGFAGARVFIDPGAVIVHDGQFHMFYNGINGFPAPVGVGYATSKDGVTWARQADQPVFGPATPGFPTEMRGTNLFVTSGIVEPDGTWVLYYYTLTGGGFDGRQTIGRATAPGPTGPWTSTAQPVLEPGPEGAWDSRQVSAPHVVRTDDGYVMYYDAASTGDAIWKIGRATSPDGVNWTKYDDPATTEPAFAESDPVLTAANVGWSATRVLDPNVVPVEGGWAMIYATNTGDSGKFITPDLHMAYATSPDGIHWTPAERPVLIGSRHASWRGVYLITLVEAVGQYYLYFDVAGGGGSGTNIFLATYAGELGA
jgi:predicted GH43/DUF377 family glycosyl hydrolase